MKQIPMRFAGAQMPCTPNVEANVKEIKKAIDYAVDNECDFLVTPEGSLSGYDHTSFTANGFYGDANQVRDMILESFNKISLASPPSSELMFGKTGSDVSGLKLHLKGKL